MKCYQIENLISGVNHGHYQGNCEQDAIDELAQVIEYTDSISAYEIKMPARKDLKITLLHRHCHLND